MMNPNDFFVVVSIIFFGGGMLVYWASRLMAILFVPEAEVNALLDNDIRMARHYIRSLFMPQLFTIP